MSDPTMASDKNVIEGLVDYGVKLEDARDYTLLGCQEIEIPGKSNFGCEDGSFNLAKAFEITINHGYDIHNFESTGNVKWAPIMLNGQIQYVISNAGGFGTTTPPPDGKPVVNIKGQTAEFAEFEPNRYYDIPYRCLVPVKVENLLAAGRNLSSDVHAQSGARLILCCLSMGEAAGTAACASIAQNVRLRDVDIRGLQSELIANGGNLGQHLRALPGISKEKLPYEDNYPNLEFHLHAETVRGESNEYTR